MMAADPAAETPRLGSWQRLAVPASGSSTSLPLQPFADLDDTDMMFNLGAVLAGSDPDEATV
jgi:hypothetical protein